MSQAITGIWRSGKHLVVDQQAAQFPNRCVWTNDDVGNERRYVEFVAEDPGRWQFSMLEGINFGGKRFHPVNLQLPVSDRWTQPVQDAKRRVGKIMFRTSAAVMLVSFLGIAWFISTEPPGTNAAMFQMVAMVIPFTFGMLGSVVGLAWPYLEGTPGPGGPLPVKRTNRQFLWIDGATPAFLDTLPTWPGESLEASFANPGTFLGMVAENWPYILVTVALMAVVIIIKVAIKLFIRGELQP